MLLTWQSILWKNKNWGDLAGLTQPSDANYVDLFGQWKVTGEILNKGNAIEITSDQRLKNSITSMPEKYELMFDNFLPRIYKYNEGTSNRTHTGFIAQEILQAIESSGLTTQDFAGYVDATQEFGCLALRYEEFIALNTWQIQKLKPRMTEAEQKIAALETELAALRTELELLKNKS